MDNKLLRRTWRSVNCVDCKWPLLTTPQGKRKRCVPCGKKWKKRKDGERPTTRSPAGDAVKEFTLTCGHKLFFRMAPQSGEHLFCSRCDGWILYSVIGGKNFDPERYCRNGHSREIYSRKLGRKWVCRECHRLNKNAKERERKQAKGLNRVSAS